MKRNKWGRNFAVGKRLGISIGWFYGAEFKAFECIIFHKMDCLIALFGIQIAKFIIEFTWNNDK